jgi:GDP-mannose 6-dehydrogenase
VPTNPRPGRPPAEPLPALSVIGLGYVGCVSAACFAARGHRVVGVDVDEQKAALLRTGRSPIVEERIDGIVADVVRSGKLRITDDVVDAISATDVTLVCVGTPSARDGSLSTEYLERACAQIGTALAAKPGWHVVVFRSTMTPGTCEGVLVPALERASGRRAGVHFGVCVNPEYLREGSSVRDFASPPKTVVGELDPRSGDVVAGLYADVPGPLFRVPIAVAEMSKYVDNAFHAVKVAFGNEIGAVCRSAGLDSHRVMDIFLADTKLNLSAAYLRPGFAFGGSCLPKDVRALVDLARRRSVDIPLLAGLIPANEAHVRRAVDLVVACGRRRVALLGLSFKAGTDDLRESPLVELAERLIGKGYDLRIHDANVSLSRLTGANRKHIAEHLPHIDRLLTDDLAEVVAHGEVLVVGAATPEIAESVARIDDRPVIDLVRLPDAAPRRGDENYIGICW